MTAISVGKLTFSFGAGVIASEFDTWAFYRKHFLAAFDGSKAIDLLAVEGTKTTWLIEVKDYSGRRRTKQIPVDEEIAKKVFATLACLPAAAVNATNATESGAAGKALRTKKIRVVFHLEQPATPSKLFPLVQVPANLALKLRKRLKPIDPHPLVVDRARMKILNLPWTVS